MSIQSNINNTIGQTAALATLSPAIQNAAETIRKKEDIKRTQAQLDKLAKDPVNIEVSGDPNVEGVAGGAVLREQRDVDRYNALIEKHNKLAAELGSAKYPTYGKAITKEEWDIFQYNIYQKAKEQRQKVEAMQKQKEAEAKAAQEFRSKQIRDLIMNPNLEVNNGTGNDPRR